MKRKGTGSEFRDWICRLRKAEPRNGAAQKLTGGGASSPDVWIQSGFGLLAVTIT